MAFKNTGTAGKWERTQFTGAQTFCGWFYRVTNRGTYETFFQFDQNSIFQTGSSGNNLSVYDGSQEIAGSAVGTGTWFHIAGVSEGDTNSDTIRLYLNGVQDISFVRATGRTGGDTRVANSSFDEWLDGRFAYLKWWTAALTAAEIANEMRTIRPIRFANLYGFWKTDPAQSSADRVKNMIGSGNNFTESGTISPADGPPVSWG